MQSVTLPTWNHNPHLLFDPATSTYLLYTLGAGFGKCGAGMPSDRQCETSERCIDDQCQGCHKGHCGPDGRAGTLPPKAVPRLNSAGYVQLGRRERPKLLLDKATGEPTMLYNGVELDGVNHPFTIATPMSLNDDFVGR